MARLSCTKDLSHTGCFHFDLDVKLAMQYVSFEYCLQMPENLCVAILEKKVHQQCESLCLGAPYKARQDNLMSLVSVSVDFGTQR